MKKLLFSFALMLSAFVAYSQDTVEVQDVINYEDFEEPSGEKDFYCGEAHYRLKYFISDNYLAGKGKKPSFFFAMHDNNNGGLLISVNKSVIKKLEVVWNDYSQKYTSDMSLFVVGSDTPWKTVSDVIGSEFTKYDKFFYGEYDEEFDENTGGIVNEITPKEKYNNYAIVPGFKGINEFASNNSFVFKFVITREITVNNSNTYGKSTEIDFANDKNHSFVISTGSGKALSIENNEIIPANLDVANDNIYFDEESTVARFIIAEDGDGNFYLIEKKSRQYLGCNAERDLILSDSPYSFALIDGDLCSSENNAVIGYNGTNFAKSEPVARAAASVDPLNMYRAETADIQTGIEDVAIDGSDNSNPEYYTLHGIRLHSQPTQPGVYICREGSKSTKIVVR